MQFFKFPISLYSLKIQCPKGLTRTPPILVVTIKAKGRRQLYKVFTRSKMEGNNKNLGSYTDTNTNIISVASQ